MRHPGVQKEHTPMAHINTAQMILEVTCAAGRLNEVQQDPAVRKTWGRAGTDLARAARSVSEAVIETRAAWGRSEPVVSVRAVGLAA